MKVSRRSGQLLFGAALSLLLASPAPLLSQPPRPIPASEIPLALKKLSVVGSALYVAAHPDDENTAMLAYLNHGRLVRTAYLSMTRGDGGQNLIGREKGELVGVIRTQELLAARRVDGAEQFFTRAVDFGYSKSPEETLAIWGREQALADVVRVIRYFRPDIIITRFPKTGEGGHGHHTSSAILAEEAFRAAADPKRFPEQISKEGLKPWQAQRIFWNVFRFRQEDPKPPKTLAVDLGTFNPFLGRAYSEIAGESRSMHKSQGFGAPERRGSIVNYLAPTAGVPADEDPLEGLDLSWKRVKGGRAIEELVTAAQKAYRPEQPELVVQPLFRVLVALRALPPDPWVDQKRVEIQEIIRAASGLWVEAIATSPTTYPGGEVSLAATVINRSALAWQLEGVEVDRQKEPGKGATLPSELKNNQPVKFDLVARIPEEADETNPYWLEQKQTKGLFQVSNPANLLKPDSAPSLMARFTLRAGAQRLVYETPVQYRWTDPVHGERYRLLEIVPKVSLSLEDSVVLFPSPAPKTIHVVLKSGKGKVSGTVRLRVPEGFRVSGPVPFSFNAEGEESRVAFELTPPESFAEGVLRADAEVDGKVFSHSIVRIDHPHIPIQTLVPPAEAKVVRFGIRTRGTNAGYVMGSGDDIPEALRQLGYRVTLLTDEDLVGDLSSYDVIVAGIRAYNTRPRLKALQRRILEYVEKGGTFLAQYNTTNDLVTNQLGPYPFKLSRDRVTVEESPVKFTKPNHPLLTDPNVVTPADFDGWVQERGLYFPGTWDERYETVLASSDPAETAKEGGLLYAKYGKGVFIYTGYSWFRQLPAGVPGAYRIFANLVAARGEK